MSITDRYERVLCAEVFVDRDQRQRTEVDVADLVDSIRKHGVLNPIIIDKSKMLIAGERRLAASIQLGLETVPVRYIEDLSPIEAQIIELEENIKRQDLPWQDDVKAVYRIHQLYSALNPGWDQTKTAKAIGTNTTLVSQSLRIARDIGQNERVAKAPNRNAAYNMLARVDDRKIGDALSEIIEAGDTLLQDEPAPWLVVDVDGAAGTLVAQKPKAPVEPPNDPITQGDFIAFAQGYSGPPFNFIHCDFPYGANVFGGKLSGRDTQQAYTDTPEVYFSLLDALCGNLDKLMSHSAHLMFWFSMEHYSATLDYFRTHAPSLEFSPFPLIWHKTDNMGLLPDPRRGPRRVYETAFIASREDRFIARAVSNAYGAPTDKAHHPSTKPEPVLRHFFGMFVDDNTRMLDPTCGSGSSLRAADGLGAALVQGLELDPVHCESARSAWRKYRALRAAARIAKPAQAVGPQGVA